MKLVWTLIFSLVSSVAVVAGGPSYPLETIEPDYDDKHRSLRPCYLRSLLYGLSFVELSAI